MQENNIFKEIHKELKHELKKVDDIIINSSKGKAELIQEITNHLVGGGGKRIRPILTILTAKLCGHKDSDRICQLAAAVELIHTATLLHDDVVDGSDLRRGKKTANSIWDNKASILVGDYLLSVAFQLMVKDGSLETLELLSRTSGIMADGEVLQLMNSTDISISEEKYLQIISSKTSILFSAAAEVGAIISKHQNRENIANFGDNLGIAFQIMDDVLDYSSEEKTFGKKLGNDFFEGKVTLPIIITYKSANNNEKDRIKEIFDHNLMAKEDERSEDFLIEIKDIMDKYQSIEKSITIAKYYQNMATKNLNLFAEGKIKNMLLEIADFSVNRSQ